MGSNNAFDGLVAGLGYGAVSRLLALRKGISFDQIRSTLERVHSAGILTDGSLIFPTPAEAQETIYKTLERLVEKIRKNMGYPGVPDYYLIAQPARPGPCGNNRRDCEMHSGTQLRRAGRNVRQSPGR